MQPCFEICSTHGSYEREQDPPIPYRTDQVVPGAILREYLRQGARFGFVGGSDGHALLWHHGAGWKRDDFRGGLTAVLAARLDRESVLGAIRARRGYATSGAPIVLDVRLDGHLMGSFVPAAGGDRLTLEVRCIGTAPIRAVYVVRDGDDVRRFEGDGRRSPGLEYREPLPAAEPRSLPGPRFDYVRVVQEDGEVAWSSPIWVGPPPGDPRRLTP